MFTLALCCEWPVSTQMFTLALCWGWPVLTQMFTLALCWEWPVMTQTFVHYVDGDLYWHFFFIVLRVTCTDTNVYSGNVLRVTCINANVYSGTVLRVTCIDTNGFSGRHKRPVCNGLTGGEVRGPLLLTGWGPGNVLLLHVVEQPLGIGDWPLECCIRKNKNSNYIQMIDIQVHNQKKKKKECDLPVIQAIVAQSIFCIIFLIYVATTQYLHWTRI